MDTDDDADREHPWYDGIGPGPRWPARAYGGVPRGWRDWWSLDWESFDGSRPLQEGCERCCEDALASGLALMLVIQLASHAVYRDMRGEDLCDLVDDTLDYIAQLELPSVELDSARRIMAALVPFLPGVLADELLRTAWHFFRTGRLRGARSLAQLAYDAAAAHFLGSAAQGAALALARLATLEECHHTARKWRGRAYVHRRRAMHH